jgi:hypothetical protein
LPDLVQSIILGLAFAISGVFILAVCFQAFFKGSSLRGQEPIRSSLRGQEPIKSYDTLSEFHRGLARSFGFYNDEWPHQSLDDRTPAAVYRGVGAPRAGRDSSDGSPFRGLDNGVLLNRADASRELLRRSMLSYTLVTLDS